jgi:hypothetical protein
MYDPMLGRFIQRDLRGMAAVTNTYSYSEDRPAVFADPTGNEPVTVGLLVVGGVIIVGVGAYAAYRWWTAPGPPPPKLSYRTVSGPTGDLCGKYNWVVTWQLDKPSPKGGFIVQKVEMTYRVKDCAGHRKKYEDDVYWEAWNVPKGWTTAKSSDSYSLETDKKEEAAFPGCEGPILVKGSAEFYEGLAALPATFRVGAVKQAVLLPATRQNPGILPGGSGPISHSLQVDWRCCPTAVKSTVKEITTTPKMD